MEAPRAGRAREVSERESFVMHRDKLNPKKDEHDEGINLSMREVRGQADHIPTAGKCVRLVVAACCHSSCWEDKVFPSIHMQVKLSSV